MLYDFPGITAQLDQPFCDLQATVCAAYAYRFRIYTQERVGVQRTVFSRDQLAFIDHGTLIRMAEIQHSDRLRDMPGTGIDLLLLSCCKGARNAQAADHLSPLIGEHAQRAQVDAGGRVRQHPHGIIGFARIGPAHMNDKMPFQFSCLRKQIRYVGWSREPYGVKQFQHRQSALQLESGSCCPEDAGSSSDLCKQIAQEQCTSQPFAVRLHPADLKIIRPVEAAICVSALPACVPSSRFRSAVSRRSALQEVTVADSSHNLSLIVVDQRTVRPLSDKMRQGLIVLPMPHLHPADTVQKGFLLQLVFKQASGQFI